MPWKEARVVELRAEFIEAWLKRQEPFSALCARYGVSRKTGHKWVQRFYDGGRPALVDRSRRPHRIAGMVTEAVATTVVALRQRYPLWGPRKLCARLRAEHPETTWPAPSTVGLLLKRRGLVPAQRRRQRTPAATQPLAAATGPNVLWCADFKGQFRVGARYCYPLTITDGFSRFLVRVEALNGEEFALVQPGFAAAFREYGLPLRLRTDNGSPFASRAVGGLSRLAVWWVKLGITPERIVPGHPEQNGQHERMHRTLKAATVRPARPSVAEQQAAFDAFRQEFNHERPHEALAMATPASVYVPSPRPYPPEVGDPEYPEGFEIRRPNKNGTLNCFGSYVCVGQVLAREAVGLELVSDGRYQLWFGPIYLGLLSQEGKGRLTFLKNSPGER